MYKENVIWTEIIKEPGHFSNLEEIRNDFFLQN